MDTIADRIKKALTIRNVKQSELATKTGIGKSSISTYISGDYEPKQRNLYKIARALGISEAWLMGADVPMEPEKTILPMQQTPDTPGTLKEEIHNTLVRCNRIQQNEELTDVQDFTLTTVTDTLDKAFPDPNP